MPEEKKYKRVLFMCPQKLYEDLSAFCQMKGYSRSEAVRRAIRDLLGQ